MGVKKYEELLCKVAYNYANKKVDKSFLLRAAELYSKARAKARDRRDRWKMKNRLENDKKEI